MNASTSGISSRSSFAKRCDMQPLTISFWPGLLVRPRCWCAWRIASIDSSLAESINAQVLMTSTSASSARDVISIPRCKTLPSMISASTRFFAQPRLIMPTLVLILRKRRGLLDSDVGVGLGQRFAIFPDLDCFAVQDPDRDMLAAEFDNAIGRRNPTPVSRRRRSIIHNYLDVGFS